MIEVKDLEKKIGENVILDKISFTVNKGEIVGFLGPNGAGKSTTMKIITTFWTQNAGEIIIDGLDGLVEPIKVRRKIGYLPENVPLYEDMLVSEYLTFVAETRSIPKIEIREKVLLAAHKCGLEKVLNRPIDELSKGFRQRVGLAQAIIHDPEILILDEPTTGLDPNQIVEIREVIKNLGKEKTVIFSTHILSEVSATCDRVIIINNGKIVGEGTPADLAARAANKELLYVKLKGVKEVIENKLKNLANVEALKLVDTDSVDVFGYTIESKENIDIRPELTRLILDSGWALLEINKKTVSLEDVFRELTK
ncbi:MAG: ATP-binding cassette domain-containing protein [bacterium]